MNAVTKLARAMQSLAENGQKVDDLAGTILKISREFKTPRRFSNAVRQAYAANGWHSGRGRPVKGEDKREPVPATVKTYVWEVRRALAAGLPAWKYTTFYELRRAMAARHLQSARRHKPIGDIDPELQGLRLNQPKTYTGHLFHDLAVAFIKVPEGKRELFRASLVRLVRTWAPAAAKAHERVAEAHQAAMQLAKQAERKAA